MKILNTLIICVVFGFVLAGRAQTSDRLMQGANLVYNGGFDMVTNNLEGWNIDFRWMNNSHYMKNHEQISVLPTYKGRSNVLFLQGRNAGYRDVFIHSKPFKYEFGARYRITLIAMLEGNPHIYCTGWMWKPGIRPYEDPHLGDLRRTYKSQFRNHRVSSRGNGWSEISFEVPMEDEKLSSMAKRALRHTRFFTVHAISVADGPSNLYIDSVKAEMIKAPPQERR